MRRTPPEVVGGCDSSWARTGPPSPGTHVRLLRSLTPEQWAREGIHVERGPESVRMIAKLYAGHDLVHLNQIARIRKVVG